VLLITDKYFRLLHFDRSGVQYTEEMDIHQDTDIFIRLIAGLSSFKESDLGLDDSIKWKCDTKGRKVSGTLTARDKNGVDTTYDLTHVDPTFSRCNIRGRCTTCWSVRDPSSDQLLLVKDSWKSENRVSEYVYLEQAKGISGVVQMIPYEADRGETKHFRGFDDALDSPDGFYNRVSVRLVLDSYGESILEFKSVLEVLYALRDAIVGQFP
jgi:hypothetical protein